jgi:membrane protein insertase Oxa1/YidC/SpoIIIJ
MLFTFLFIWGSVFSICAGLVAFLISYLEMSRHYVEKRKPLMQAAQTGVLTFLFFMCITLALAFGLPSFFA